MTDREKAPTIERLSGNVKEDNIVPLSSDIRSRSYTGLTDILAGSETSPEEALEKFEVPSRLASDIDFSFDIQPLRCGFKTLEDQHILRARQPDLVVIAARPGHCKTALGINIAMRVADYAPVLFYSLEMTGSQIALRMVTLEADMPLAKLRFQPTSLVQRYRDKIKKYNIRVDDTNGLDINTLVTRAKDYNRRSQLAMIVVDYLQIIASVKRERRDKIADIADQLKSLAKSIGCPIVALAQLNREFERRIAENPVALPMMGDIADSADIERFADSVTILHKPYPDLVNAFMVKNRHGQSVNFELKFKPDVGRLIDLGIKEDVI